MSKYDVGYGKPPKQHQFKKGQPAANPKGRPKGRKPKSFLEKLEEKVVVDTRNGRRVKKTLREVLDHYLVKDALAGDKHARSLIYRYREAAEKGDATPKSVTAKDDQQGPLLEHQPPFTIPPTTEERREVALEIIKKAVGKLHQNIDEAIELGIFEIDGLGLKLTSWARAAAEGRLKLPGPALADGAAASTVER